MSPEEDLILGIITPKRFVQGMAMLPAVTLVASRLPDDWAWLGISFGVAGTALISLVVVRAVIGGRRLNSLFWILLVLQIAALGLVLFPFATTATLF